MSWHQIAIFGIVGWLIFSEAHILVCPYHPNIVFVVSDNCLPPCTSARHLNCYSSHSSGIWGHVAEKSVFEQVFSSDIGSLGALVLICLPRWCSMILISYLWVGVSRAHPAEDSITSHVIALIYWATRCSIRIKVSNAQWDFPNNEPLGHGRDSDI